MKNIFKISSLLLIVFTFIACGNDEDQVVPDFLDGTQYGVLLDVNVSTATEVAVATINNYNLKFDVNVKGVDKRPVESIVVNKTFTSANGSSSSPVSQETITSFPKNVSISMSDLVQNIPNLSINDLAAGDTFSLKFTINYTDGYVVDKFDSSMRTNFNVKITE